MVRVPSWGVTVAALALSACTAGQPGADPVVGADPGESLAGSASDTVDQADGGTAASFAFASGGSCVTRSPMPTGTPLPDVDGDGFRDVLITITLIDCEPRRGTGTVSGVVTVLDAALGDPSLNVRRTFAMRDADGDPGIVISREGISTRAAITGTGMLAVISSGSYSFSRIGDVEGTMVEGTVEDLDTDAAIDFAESIEWDATYEPTDGAWTSPKDGLEDGTIEIDGSWEVDLEVDGEIRHGEGTVATAALLEISTACESRIVGGAIESVLVFEDETLSTTVTWTDCGEYTTVTEVVESDDES